MSLLASRLVANIYQQDSEAMQVLSNISSFATIIAFLVPYFFSSQNTTQSTSNFQYVCLGLFALSSVYTLIISFKNKPKKYSKKVDIDEYMFNWISQDGRAVIFTRDMSWADSIGMIDMLKAKANKQELTIVMSHSTNLTNELKAYGAEIVLYGGVDFIPSSRFTIIRDGRSDARVAIGRRYSNGEHVIEEFDNSTHPLFSVATDLVSVLKKLEKR